MSSSSSTAAAFADLQWLRRLAVVLAADVDDADDLVQETLVAAWARSDFDAQTSLRPWLASVLRNRFRMLRRGRARREVRERAGEVASAAELEPEREMERLEVLRILLAELDALPAEDRAIVVRRFFDGETAADIAIALDMPAATVRSRLHRAVKRLRAALDQRCGDRRAWCAALGVGPTVVPEPTASHTKGQTVSVATKGILIAGIVGVGGAIWAASQRTAPERPEPATVVDQESAPEKQLWERRREHIRRSLPSASIPAGVSVPRPDDTEALERRHVALRELVDACLDDLGSDVNGALTIDVVEIGAPDVGVIFESLEVLTQTIDDPELLRCITESMYAFVDEPPEQSYERTYTRTTQIGRSEQSDEVAQRTFDAIVGAHIGEVRYCQRQVEGSAEGMLPMSVTIASEGTVEAASPGVSALPPRVVDCIARATLRWKFPTTLAGKTMHYSFALPIAEREERE